MVSGSSWFFFTEKPFQTSWFGIQMRIGSPMLHTTTQGWGNGNGWLSCLFQCFPYCFSSLLLNVLLTEAVFTTSNGRSWHILLCLILGFHAESDVSLLAFMSSPFVYFFSICCFLLLQMVTKSGLDACCRYVDKKAVPTLTHHIQNQQYGQKTA